LGDSRIIRKSVAATTAGADDAMPARRVKAISGFGLKTKKKVLARERYS
jgi:hypothetical protein